MLMQYIAVKCFISLSFDLSNKLNNPERCGKMKFTGDYGSKADGQSLKEIQDSQDR